MNRRPFCVSFWRGRLWLDFSVQCELSFGRVSVPRHDDAGRPPSTGLCHLFQRSAREPDPHSTRTHALRGHKLLTKTPVTICAPFATEMQYAQVALLYRSARSFLIASNPMDAIVKKEVV